MNITMDDVRTDLDAPLSFRALARVLGCGHTRLHYWRNTGISGIKLSCWTRGKLVLTTLRNYQEFQRRVDDLYETRREERAERLTKTEEKKRRATELAKRIAEGSKGHKRAEEFLNRLRGQ